MTRKEYAAKKGLTVEALREQELAWLQNEGYDDDGKEYETLDAWIDRKPARMSYDPYDGGRGSGNYGVEA